MKKTHIGIDEEGYPFIFIFAFSTIIFAILNWWQITLFMLAITCFCWFFFRDPERIIPNRPHTAVSPADGKIIRIESCINPITQENNICISIFMNIFNVHVNRFPLKGQVESILYTPGLFMNASFDKASKKNERCAYLIRDQEGKHWTIVQIAGLIARRIVCRVKEGDILNQGERFGMIRFGSRVDMYLPEDYTLNVSLGDKVFAGETILAKKDSANTIKP